MEANRSRRKESDERGTLNDELDEMVQPSLPAPFIVQLYSPLSVLNPSLSVPHSLPQPFICSILLPVHCSLLYRTG